MPVTLESRTRRMQVFHLPHDVFCRGRCACTEVTVVVTAENPRTGERAPRQLQKKVPGSITLLSRERKQGLPSAVLVLAEVKVAVSRGYVRIVEQTPDDATGPGTEAAPSAPSSTAASTSTVDAKSPEKEPR